MTALAHPSYQPYWVAFAYSQGKRPEDLTRNYGTHFDYCEWIEAQWRAFGFGPHAPPLTPADREGFLAFLEQRTVVPA